MQNLVDEQIQCWNCEESVHSFTSNCPYCRVDLHRHPVQKAAVPQDKITPIPHLHVSEKPVVQEESFSTFSFVLSLFFLISGSSLFFLAIAITLFSRDGAFTLSWTEQSWTAFLGLGITFAAIGFLFLQRLPDSSQE
jgi:hypothetical protein